MLLENVFHTDAHNHEDVPMTVPGMPYVCIHTHMDSFPERKIAWHWHTALEFVYVDEGAVELCVPDHRVILSKGTAVFVNTGVLHEYVAAAEEPCSIYANLFNVQLLSGNHGSVFEEKYFSPVCRQGVPTIWLIKPDNLERVEMIRNLLETIELAAAEPEGYEFELRSKLSALWLGLWKETKEIRQNAPARSMADIERIKQMMKGVQAMKIRNQEDLKKFEAIIDQCSKTVWVVTPSGEQFDLKDPHERSQGLSRMLCMKEYEEPEVFTNCAADEMLLFGFIEESRRLAA